MQNKKSSQADLSKNRMSFLLLGLICSTSLTLMSFEYSTFSSINQLEGVKVTSDHLIPTPFDPVKLYVPPKPKVNTEIDKSMVQEGPQPLPVPEPTPIPDPGPVNPFIGFEPDPIIEPVHPDPIIEIEDIFEIVEVMPEFPGGQEEMYNFLSKNMHYPTISLDNASEGIAYVKFVVEKNGEITDLKIVKGVDQYIDKEALRVIKNMPNWTAGEQMGRKVRVSFVLPVNFTIN